MENKKEIKKTLVCTFDVNLGDGCLSGCDFTCKALEKDLNEVTIAKHIAAQSRGMFTWQQIKFNIFKIF